MLLKHGMKLQASLHQWQLTNLVTFYGADFNDKIIKTLYKIPNTVKIIQSGIVNPNVVEILLDHNVFKASNGKFKDNHS